MSSFIALRLTVSLNNTPEGDHLKTINKNLNVGKLNEAKLDKIFCKWWPELEENIQNEIDKAKKVTEVNTKRNDREIIEEILLRVRSIQHSQHKKERIMQQGVFEVVPSGPGGSSPPGCIPALLPQDIQQLPKIMEKDGVQYVIREPNMGSPMHMPMPIPMIVRGTGGKVYKINPDGSAVQIKGNLDK